MLKNKPVTSMKSVFDQAFLAKCVTLQGLSPFIHAMHFCLILSDILWTACIHDSFFLLPLYVNVLMVQQQLHYLFLLFPYELCSN